MTHPSETFSCPAARRWRNNQVRLALDVSPYASSQKLDTSFSDARRAVRCGAREVGDYIARWEDDGETWGDDEHAEIEQLLARRGLAVETDDIGLRVVDLEGSR